MVGDHLESELHPIDKETIKSLLEFRAETDTQRTFLQYGHSGQELSFDDVNTKANSIAHSLAEMGVQKGDSVSMLVENKLYGTLIMFGVHKLGAVFAPINYEYTGSLLTKKLDEINPAVLFVEDSFIAQLNRIADDLVELPEIVITAEEEEASSLDDKYSMRSIEAVLANDESNPDVAVSWNDDAAIIYTSGTTGEPKGVVVPYRWIIYYSAARWQIFDREDVVHTSLPLYHGAAPYWDIAPALIVGTSVALWDRYSPNEFLERVNKYEATTVTLISVMHSWLMDQPKNDDDNQNTLNKVQVSPLPEYHEEMAERFSIDFFTSKFGQQESGNPLTGLIRAVQGADATPENLRRGLTADEIIARAAEMDIPVVNKVPADRWIGKQMPWMEVSVVNDQDEHLPPNEIGELVVRPKKPSVTFRQYYNRPEDTLKEMKNLWFHVGDAVYYDEEDNFYHVDRIGNIIRRRGENIPAKQIENLVNAHGEVGETAAMAVPAEEGGEDEIAIVVEPIEGAKMNETALRPHLESELPDFMQPQYIIFAEKLPMTETNKIKRDIVQERYLNDL